MARKVCPSPLGPQILNAAQAFLGFGLEQLCGLPFLKALPGYSGYFSEMPSFFSCLVALQNKRIGFEGACLQEIGFCQAQIPVSSHGSWFIVRNYLVVLH